MAFTNIFDRVGFLGVAFISVVLESLILLGSLGGHIRAYSLILDAIGRNISSRVKGPGSLGRTPRSIKCRVAHTGRLPAKISFFCLQ